MPSYYFNTPTRSRYSTPKYNPVQRRLVWDVHPAQALGDLAVFYGGAIRETLQVLFQVRAEEAESWMKTNAPWTDRTFTARPSLFAEVVSEPGSISMRLSQGSMRNKIGRPYGPYLEGYDPINKRWMVNAGKWEIVQSAMARFVRIIRDDLKVIFRPRRWN